MNETVLKAELKKKVIEYLNLLEVKPEDIADDDQLFGPKFDLDSIDALELTVLLEREYGIKINDPAEGRKVFLTIGTMAAYILEKKRQS